MSSERGAVIENPIINSPFEEPALHWAFDEETRLPTGEIEPGRRRSETWVPIAQSRKGRKSEQLALDLPQERKEPNSLIGDIRKVVGEWRRAGYQHVTPTTHRLLDYWMSPEREHRLFFAQCEAVETAIYLTEVRDKLGQHWLTNELAQANAEHNAGLPRVALKMATGTGKTVVMAMLIAWQTLNKVANQQDARFSKRFLLVSPGVTIRDRLRVLKPAEEKNYYKDLDIVPADLWTALRQAQVEITNYHAFLPKVTKDGQGVSSFTKNLLLAKSAPGQDPFTETPAQIVNRVLKPFSNSGAGKGGQIIVINDEAHHCYQERAEPVGDGVTVDQLSGEDKKAAAEENEHARVWFKGLQYIANKPGIGIKTIYDLSATPQFLKGSGWPEGYLFPWVVSDFSLMDAIEAGLVKIPRVPVDDNAPGEEVVYLNLWNRIGTEMPKRASKNEVQAAHPLPATLSAAMESLYDSYRRAYEHWEATANPETSTPPVYIVVANNTVSSKWIYDKIAGYTVPGIDGVPSATVLGELPLFSNYDDEGRPLTRPRTIIVDSTQLEGDNPQISPEFKQVAAAEVEVFKEEYRKRGGDPDAITDAMLLREVMNTVGKKGTLGEHVRCVVSVSMLTEGWDANTVTHILGVRAFGSQLLCEQVVGRGLRRVSHDLNSKGHFDPEYADVYGVPFQFVQTDPNQVLDQKPRPIPKRVRAVPDRVAQRITFPKLDGYRVEIEDAKFHTDFGPDDWFVLDATVATRTTTSGVVGGTEDEQHIGDGPQREQAIAFKLAEELLDKYRDPTKALKPWLFPNLVAVSKAWMRECLVTDTTTRALLVTNPEIRTTAVEAIHRTLSAQPSAQPARVLPIFQRFEPEGSTDDVDFFTAKPVMWASEEKCPVNYVVLDAVPGAETNAWEQLFAELLESRPEVEAYVKNDHLEFAIPYQFAGRSHRYLPDFIVRLRKRDASDPKEPVCHLILEVSGGQKEPSQTQAKAQSARLWCKAVNTHGGFGRWGYKELRTPARFRAELIGAIELMYRDAMAPFDEGTGVAEAGEAVHVYQDGAITGRSELALPSQFTDEQEEMFSEANFFISAVSDAAVELGRS